jgi:hypothetical protein
MRLAHTGTSLTTRQAWTVVMLVDYATAPKDGANHTMGTIGPGKVCNLQGVSCQDDGTVYLTEQNDLRRLDRAAD